MNLLSGCLCMPLTLPGHGSEATNTHATRGQFLDAEFSMRSISYQIACSATKVDMAKTILYVRYVHLTKAKYILKRQTHPPVREVVT
jgi:hypothetical protein